MFIFFIHDPRNVQNACDLSQNAKIMLAAQLGNNMSSSITTLRDVKYHLTQIKPCCMRALIRAAHVATVFLFQRRLFFLQNFKITVLLFQIFK